MNGFSSFIATHVFLMMTLFFVFYKFLWHYIHCGLWILFIIYIHEISKVEYNFSLESPMKFRFVVELLTAFYKDQNLI
jgi:hypothetical protein